MLKRWTLFVALSFFATALGQSTLSIIIHEAPWLPGFEAVVDAYEAQTGNRIELVISPYPGLLQKVLNATTATESEFDIVEIDEVWTGQVFSGGLVSPLREIKPDFVYDAEVIEYGSVSRWDVNANAALPDSELHAVPLLGNIQLLFYRKDLLEAAGFDVPQTWEALAEAASVINNPPGVYGYAERTAGRIDFNYQSVLRSYGGEIVSFNTDTQSWSVEMDSDASITALETWLELAKTASPPNYVNLGQAELISLMQSGQLGMMINVAAAAGALVNPDASIVTDSVAAAPNPGLVMGEPVTTSGVLVFSVPHNLPDERKQLAAEFLEWFISKDTQLIFARAGGVPVRTDVYEELSSEPAFWWARAVVDSAPFIQGQIRLAPTSQLYEVLNRVLGEVLLEQKTPRQALEEAAVEMRLIMRDNGFTVDD